MLVTQADASVRLKVTCTDCCPPPAGITAGLIERAESKPGLKETGIVEFRSRPRDWSSTAADAESGPLRLDAG
jgi:hypothetical protein